MILELAVVAQLATRCAPFVAFETLAAVIRTESGFEPLAIGVNGGSPRFPATYSEAVAVATDLIERQHRSVDLGLMQINSANLASLGLSIADAFEPCRNITAGARLLRQGYAIALRTEADPQGALRVALSRYNTGSSERGFANGYVLRVQGAAEVVVPAIRLRGEATSAAQRLATPAIPDPPNDSDAFPEWDVWARATHASRPRLVVAPREAPAVLGDIAETTLTNPPRTAE